MQFSCLFGCNRLHQRLGPRGRLDNPGGREGLSCLEKDTEDQEAACSDWMRGCSGEDNASPKSCHSCAGWIPPHAAHLPNSVIPLDLDQMLLRGADRGSRGPYPTKLRVSSDCSSLIREL